MLVHSGKISLLQGETQGLVTHGMQGFDYDKAGEIFRFQVHLMLWRW